MTSKRLTEGVVLFVCNTMKCDWKLQIKTDTTGCYTLQDLGSSSSAFSQLIFVCDLSC